MPLSEQEIYLLITRHLSFNTTTEEDEWLAAWIASSKENALVFGQLKTIWLSSGRVPGNTAEATDALAALKMKLQAPAETPVMPLQEQPVQNSTGTKNKAKKILLWSAATACMVAACLLFFLKNDVPPATATPDKVMVATQKTTITLSDGTFICLAPGSRISYPEKFDAATRVVHLQGQAFFKVTQNAHQPFTVVSGDVNADVLGTSFTVSAFDNQERISIALVEGKLSISDSASQFKHLLQPGMELLYNRRTKETNIKEIDANDNVTGWMSRQLVFNNIPLSEAAVQLQAVYGVKLVFENNAAAACKIWGKFKNESLGNVLETIKLAGIRYSMRSQDTVFISAKKLN